MAAEQHHHHRGDPVAHHADKAAGAAGLKKKVGPLPMWAWIVIVGGTIAIVMFRRKGAGSASQSGSTVDPNNPLGLTYAQEQADMAQGIDPSTGESYAAEQSAIDSLNTGGLSSGGGDGSTGGGSTDNTDQLNAIDSDLQSLQYYIAAMPVNDGATPEPTFASELGDVADGITSLNALQTALTPAPITVAPPAAPAKAAATAARKPATPAKASTPAPVASPVAARTANTVAEKTTAAQAKNNANAAKLAAMAARERTATAKKRTVSGKKKKVSGKKKK